MDALTLISKHEGLRLTAYKDTVGKLTTGYGFNLDSAAAKAICKQVGLDYQAIRNGTAITEAQADAILALQLGMVNAQARTLFPNFQEMPEPVKAVVQDLVFNLGLSGFMKFVKFIEAIKAGKWDVAAGELVDSLWFDQTKTRGVEDVALLRSASRTND